MPAASEYLARVTKGGAEARAVRKELCAVIDDAGGVIAKIIKKLKVSRRSVFRLLERADLVEYALRARKKSGARDRRNGLLAVNEVKSHARSKRRA